MRSMASTIDLQIQSKNHTQMCDKDRPMIKLINLQNIPSQYGHLYSLSLKKGATHSMTRLDSRV